jgi:hypothetical protein
MGASLSQIAPGPGRFSGCLTTHLGDVTLGDIEYDWRQAKG